MSTAIAQAALHGALAIEGARSPAAIQDTLRAVGVFVQLETPIAFDAIDNQPVDLLFALLVPADQTKTHLHTLSLVAKRLADKAICRRLRAAQSDEELYEIITEAGSSDDA